MKIRALLKLIEGDVDDFLILHNQLLIQELSLYKKRYGKVNDLDDFERICLAKIAKEIGYGKISEIDTLFKPDTLFKWYRHLVKKKNTYPHKNKKMGRPGLMKNIENYIVKFATENKFWGYLKIIGALKTVGYKVAPNTVKNVLKRNGIPPSSERIKNNTWKEFLANHKVWATDFLTHEVITLTRLKRYYLLFFIEIASRKVVLGGITRNPNKDWMKQVARNVTMDELGELKDAEYLIHDGDGKYIKTGFSKMINDSGIKTMKLPSESPNLNAFAERWVRSIKDECLNRVLPLGERFFR